MSYVYLAPLKDKTAFKIGKTEQPMKRLTFLSYIHNLDGDGIKIVKCPSASASFRLETLLHEAFERSQILTEGDGGTEFFDYCLYPTALDVCTALCRGNSYSFVTFLPDKKMSPPTPIEILKQKISDAVRNKRLTLNLSQTELAKVALVSKKTVERLEAEGQATLVNFLKISSALGLEKQFVNVVPPINKRAKRRIFVGDSDHEPEKDWVQTIEK